MRRYYDPITKFDIDRRQLAAFSEEDALEVVKAWFLRNFCNPAECCPVDDDGRYLFVYGGPYDCSEELIFEFGGVFSREWLKKAADQLVGEMNVHHWSGVGDGLSIYEGSLIEDAISGRHDPYKTFLNSKRELSGLIESEGLKGESERTLLKLAYSGVIGALEGYLSFRITALILREDQYRERFVEHFKPFQDEKLKYSEILKEVTRLDGKIKRILLDLPFHKLQLVENITKHVFGFDLPREKTELMKAVKVRHDIVHRDGRDATGAAVQVTKKSVLELLDVTAAFVEGCEEGLSIDDIPF